MMFSLPNKDYDLKPETVKALDLIFLLHAITSRIARRRRCGWWRRAGRICSPARRPGCARCGVRCTAAPTRRCWRCSKRFISRARRLGSSLPPPRTRNSGKRLMGFGHRVYKHYDPRAKIIKKACDDVLAKLPYSTTRCWTLPRTWRRAALRDSLLRRSASCIRTWIFYSGIIMRAIRHPGGDVHGDVRHRPHAGWIANYKEVMEAPTRIYRPRQIYTGPTLNHYVPIKEREMMSVGCLRCPVGGMGQMRSISQKGRAISACVCGGGNAHREGCDRVPEA